jgi:diamine N-acetyltransferase
VRDMIEIRDIGTTEQLEESLVVIHRAFATVAHDMNLTQDDAPTHPAFLSRERLKELHNKAACFGLYIDGKQVGFGAAEKADGGIYYLDRLAILPEQRHREYGKYMVDFVIDYVKKQGGSVISLGMIDSMTILKDWYKSLGFKETGTKKFESLPFLVCFMDKDIST